MDFRGRSAAAAGAPDLPQRRFIPPAASVIYICIYMTLCLSLLLICSRSRLLLRRAIDEAFFLTRSWRRNFFFFLIRKGCALVEYALYAREMGQK